MASGVRQSSDYSSDILGDARRALPVCAAKLTPGEGLWPRRPTLGGELPASGGITVARLRLAQPRAAAGPSADDHDHRDSHHVASPTERGECTPSVGSAWVCNVDASVAVSVRP